MAGSWKLRWLSARSSLPWLLWRLRSAWPCRPPPRFVGGPAVRDARLGRTAMAAAAKSDADKITAMLPDRKYKSAMLPVEFTTGAVNQISIVTPPISSEGIQGYFSLNIILFFGIAMFTAGGLIEIQRFFPDATYL